MNTTDINVMRASATPWRNSVAIYMGNPKMGYVVEKVIFKKVEDGLIPTIYDAPIQLTLDEAQVLMDDLWNAGLRPTEGTGSAGSLRATERHLDDMRKIASKAVGVDL